MNNSICTLFDNILIDIHKFKSLHSYKTWGAAATYHLCIDSSVLGIAGTVDYIEEFVRKKLNLDITIR